MTESIIELDVHGMTLYQAKVVIDAKLRRSAGAYRIRVIHGYHGGTSLRDGIRKEYAKHPKVLRIELGLNPGDRIELCERCTHKAGLRGQIARQADAAHAAAVGIERQRRVWL